MVQEDLLNILFCYSRRFPDLSYRQVRTTLLAPAHVPPLHHLYILCAVFFNRTCRDVFKNMAPPLRPRLCCVCPQGMHEVCALLYLAVHRDQLKQDDPVYSEAPAVMKATLDQKFVAHDVYSLFCSAMETATDWFIQNNTVNEVTL